MFLLLLFYSCVDSVSIDTHNWLNRFLALEVKLFQKLATTDNTLFVSVGVYLRDDFTKVKLPNKISVIIILIEIVKLPPIGVTTNTVH